MNFHVPDTQLQQFSAHDILFQLHSSTIPSTAHTHWTILKQMQHVESFIQK